MAGSYVWLRTKHTGGVAEKNLHKIVDTIFADPRHPEKFEVCSDIDFKFSDMFRDKMPHDDD